MRKVRGIGINDTENAGPACSLRDESGRKFNYVDYRVWYGILVRATEQKADYVYHTYSDVSICEDWLTRSNFQNWYLSHPTIYENSGNLLEVDKDLLVPGNKVYSPETCALVPSYLNISFIYRSKSSYDLPMWVSYRKRNKDMKSDLKKPYRATISGDNQKFIHLEYFATPEEAHSVAQKEKVAILEEILVRYKNEECFRHDVFDSVEKRVAKIRTDNQNGVITLSL